MPEGHDHTVSFRGDTVLRRSRPGGDGLDVTREAALIEVVRARTSVPVPRVLRTWPSRGLMEAERAAGTPLLQRLADLTPRDAERLAGALGDVITSIAAVPRREVAHLVPEEPPEPGVLLQEAVDTCSRDDVLGLVPTSVRPALEDFLGAAPALAEPAALRLVHGDLGAEHVFVTDDLTITAIIDWSDATLGDPAFDLGLVLRDLGTSAGEVAVARHAAEPDEVPGLLARARFYARVRALEDLAYGIDEDAPLYADNAVRAIRRLFSAET
jgi:aminoglycoside phosphotransferase (APT) family kinase protein